MKRNRTIYGFTVFELLIVIALIGIMISIALVSFDAVRAKSRDGERLSVIKDTALALDDYYTQCGSYPYSLNPADQVDDAGPCPLHPDNPLPFYAPDSVAHATFGNDNTFTITKYGTNKFFYVPLATEQSVTDSCDAYHMGVELETKDRSLNTDDDFDSSTSSMVFNNIPRTICPGALSTIGYDGADGTVNEYDIVR